LTDNFERRLKALAQAAPEALRGGRMGLEKETLRVGTCGAIAQTPHPPALGSALTHPWITTDYSEALLELITPPFGEPDDALHFLRELQAFVYPRLGDELMWATSMPCVVAGEEKIPVARYGDSNAGRMKTLYRIGLGHRYGRVMQVIAGVHFNYSLPEAFWPLFAEIEGRIEGDGRPLRAVSDDAYFGMIRNLQRLGWLVPYLFGASPAVCKSFFGGHPSAMPEFNENTYYEPYGTSLRMSDIGYQNRKEAETGVHVCYDGLDSYVASLREAIRTPSPIYQAIGVKVGDEWRQLNANILQIENEYYSTIRPKQVLDLMEKPSEALQGRGVRYVELRSLDVNAFDPLGVNEEQLRFLEAFLVYCLLTDSPSVSSGEREEIDANQLTAARRGRAPGVALRRDAVAVGLKEWACEVLDRMQGVCELLDRDVRNGPYAAALAAQRAKAEDPELTPSARMLREMSETEEGFHEFAWRMSQKHQRYFEKIRLDPARERELEIEAAESLERQREMEAADDVSFDDYLARYFG
jgi:glutamate--cysteine ligase